MQRLFAGTPWDRPPTCERCGELEANCQCPKQDEPKPPAVPPEKQIAKIALEKRPGKRTVTVIRGLQHTEAELQELTSFLKASCGAGGTVRDGLVEIQGNQLDRAEAELKTRGYRTKRG